MLRRAWSGLRWLAALAAQMLAANVHVAGLVLRPRRPVRSGVVEVPLDIRTDLAITMLAHSITLIPGTITVDVAPDRSRLLVHALELDDPAATVEEIKRTLEAPIRGFVE